MLCAEGDGLLFICIGFGGRNRSRGIEAGHRADGKAGEGVVQGSGYNRCQLFHSSWSVIQVRVRAPVDGQDVDRVTSEAVISETGGK